MEDNKRNYGAAAVLALLFLLLLAFNFMTPLNADDFLFCFSRAHWSKITGVAEIPPSMAALRRNTNGRVFAHFFVQLFLLWPRPVFRVVNAACGAGLFALLHRYVRCGDRKRDLLLLLFLIGTVWLLLPAFGQVFLWLTGACNYSWTILVTLAFLLPFFRLWMRREQRWSPPGRALYLPLAFIAGAWSENGSLAMLCAAFCFLALSWRRDRRAPRFLLLSFCAACAGFLFLMLAPSELNGRRGEVSESTLTKAAGRLWDLLRAHLSAPLLIAAGVGALLVLALLLRLLIRHRALGCRLCGVLVLLVYCAGALGLRLHPSSLIALLSDTGFCLLTALCLYLALLLAALGKRVPAETLLAAAVLGLSALASIAVFLFAVYFPPRSACPFICYTTLADALLLAALWDREPGRRLPSLCVWACAAAAAMLLTLPSAARDIADCWRQAEARDALLRASAGQTVRVEMIRPESKYPAAWPGDESYFDQDIALYYDLGGFAVSAYADH